MRLSYHADSFTADTTFDRNTPIIRSVGTDDFWKVATGRAERTVMFDSVPLAVACLAENGSGNQKFGHVVLYVESVSASLNRTASQYSFLSFFVVDWSPRNLSSKKPMVALIMRKRPFECVLRASACCIWHAESYIKRLSIDLSKNAYATAKAEWCDHPKSTRKTFWFSSSIHTEFRTTKMVRRSKLSKVQSYRNSGCSEGLNVHRKYWPTLL